MRYPAPSTVHSPPHDGWRWRASVVLAALGVAALACSLRGRPTTPRATGTDAADAVPAPVELRRAPKCPAIHLVAREGDPLPAVAFAVAHGAGSQASAALGGLLEHRLASRGFTGVEVQVHHLGVQLQRIVRSPDEAAKLVAAITHALREPVVDGDPGLLAAQQRIARLRGRTWAGPVQGSVAKCLGEAGIPGGTKLVDVTREASSVERWRRLVHSTRAAAFGAVGPQNVLEAAAKAVVKTRPWPTQPEPEDNWPDGDRIGAESGLDGRRLSLAWRVAKGDSALAAARRLSDDSTLEQRIETVDASWRVARIATALRPRGACVGVDLEGPEGPEPAAHTVATLALIALDETSRALTQSTEGDFALRQSLLLPSDPRDAAGAAAWQALAAQLDPGPPRRFVSYLSQASAELPDLKAEIARLEDSWRRSSLDEVRHRVEPGQGEVWALLASPCGPVAEGANTAGYSALLVRTLAENSDLHGIQLEPWVTADGVGLLAHGPRSGPEETAIQHAERIGAALGRALMQPLDGQAIARTRAEVHAALGPGPRPGWWLTIEALAPSRPSWLEPRGTWQSIADATTHAVAAGRAHLAAGPLRLAVLANIDQSQAAAVAAGVDRWLRPLRGDKTVCPTAPRSAPRAGRMEIETSAGPGIAAAHVAVALPPTGDPIPHEAYYTLWLMNRAGGWLDQALRRTGLVAGARAFLLGGRRAGAIVVTLEADQEQTEAAISQVRALFTLLAEGAASARDFEHARREFGREAARSRLDPRRRVVEIWQRTNPDPPTFQSLRTFHAATFAADQHVVVVVKQKP